MDWTIIIILSIALIFLITFLIVRIQINKKINKIEENKANLNKKALNEILGTDKKVKNPRESLTALNKIAKEFFKVYLKEKEEDTYVEIEELLKKKKQKDMIDFCEKMDILLYSGKEIKKSQAIDMIEEFRTIMMKIKRA